MGLFRAIQSALTMRFWLAVFLGLIFSLVVWKTTTFDLRYTLALCGGFLTLSMAMMTVSFIDDFLICALVFNIPFSSYGKWLAAQPVAIPARGINIGLAELLIAVAYFSWFIKVFVIREEPLPKLTKIDFFIVFLLVVQGISFLGAANQMLAFFDIVYNIKHALIYFYLAHKIRKRHLKGIINLVLFAIIVEGTIAVYETATGNVGIGVTKGNISSTEFGTQPYVPGIEDEVRAAGTTIDSHSLGLYFAMILPIPLVFLLTQFYKSSFRLLLLLVFLFGLSGLLVTFSRSGWLSFAITSLLSVSIIFFSWKQDRALFVIFFLFVSLIPFYPQLHTVIDKRFMQAPSELIDVRFEMAQTAVNIWMANPFFGYGPGNYLEAIDDPRISNTGHYGEMAERPVHNSFLWIAAELGLFGLMAYGGIILTGIYNCIKLLRNKDRMVQGMSLALVAGFLAYLLDGVTNMMFREAEPYVQLMLYLALSQVLQEQAALQS